MMKTGPEYPDYPTIFKERLSGFPPIKKNERPATSKLNKILKFQYWSRNSITALMFKDSSELPEIWIKSFRENSDKPVNHYDLQEELNSYAADRVSVILEGYIAQTDDMRLFFFISEKTAYKHSSYEENNINKFEPDLATDIKSLTGRYDIAGIINSVSVKFVGKDTDGILTGDIVDDFIFRTRWAAFLEQTAQEHKLTRPQALRFNLLMSGPNNDLKNPGSWNALDLASEIARED